MTGYTDVTVENENSNAISENNENENNGEGGESGSTVSIVKAKVYMFQAVNNDMILDNFYYKYYEPVKQSVFLNEYVECFGIISNTKTYEYANEVPEEKKLLR